MGQSENDIYKLYLFFLLKFILKLCYSINQIHFMCVYTVVLLLLNMMPEKISKFYKKKYFYLGNIMIIITIRRIHLMLINTFLFGLYRLTCFTKTNIKQKEGL